jgi:phospholipase/lecithinase/hemolysin
MPRQFARVLATVVALFLLLATPTASLATDPVRRFIIFGDSLSDPGNYFLAFHQVSLRPFEPVPDAPYAIGGLHFSNGRTWAERLTNDLHLTTSGLPALLEPRAFTNYAVGRARARADAPVFPFFDIATQVDRFLTDFGGHAPTKALYVIWIGANDLGDALLTASGGGDPTPVITEAVLATGAAIGTLYAAGARRFLIFNLPNLALTPFVHTQGPVAEFVADSLSTAYNDALTQALDDLENLQLPGLELIRFDVNPIFNEILLNPQAFGLTNVEDSCLAFGVLINAICRRPNQYLFWDGIHPTTAGHDIIADAVREFLTAP